MFTKGQRVWSAYATVKNSWDGEPMAMVNEYEVVDAEMSVVRPVLYGNDLGQCVVLRDLHGTEAEAWRECGKILSAEILKATNKMHQCFAKSGMLKEEVAV